MASPSDPEAQTGSDLEARISMLEKCVLEKPQEDSTDWLRFVEVASKVLIPLLIFYLAFTFKDSVEQALAYRKLEVESADAIEKLLNNLHKPEIEDSEAIASALTLSAYGEAAIMPLVSVYEHGSAVSEPAAKQGLFVIGLSHPESVTSSLNVVLSKHQGQFRWQTHRMAIEILGQISHPQARDVLCAYLPYLEKTSSEGLTAWNAIATGGSAENYDNTRKSLETALSRLEGDSECS